MKISAILAALVLLCSARGSASTVINNPFITTNMHWTVSGSPYYLDTTVETIGDLIIDPGVEVIARGHYGITIYGQFSAEGTATAPIRFHVNDTTGWSNLSIPNGGWKGIHVYWNPSPSVFAYCTVTDIKSCAPIYADAALESTRTITIHHCNFYHNESATEIVLLTCDTTGTTEMYNCNFHDNRGDGPSVFSFNWGTTWIHDNHFYDNFCMLDIVGSVGSNAVFLRNEVDHNTCGFSSQGAPVHMGGNAVIKKNKIHHNTTTTQAPITFDDDTLSTADIIDNFIYNNHNPHYDCAITDGGSGVLSHGGGSLMVRNNVIVNNYSQGGGVIALKGTIKAAITNNTIVNNISDALEGGCVEVNSYYGRMEIRNNIFFNNTSLNNIDFCLISDSTCFINGNFIQRPLHSDILKIGGWPSIVGDTSSNIISTATPGLVSPTTAAGADFEAASADFSLAASSICRDRGDSLSLRYDTTDYKGNTRIWGQLIDIGAYEWVPWTSTGIASVEAQTGLQLYPNPTTANLFVTTATSTGTVRVIDMLGNIVLQKQVNGSLTYVDVHTLSRGVYTAVWIDGNNSTLAKFTIE